jgi:hypothetical protein
MAGGVHSSESIPGHLKRLQIRALTTKVSPLLVSAPSSCRTGDLSSCPPDHVGATSAEEPCVLRPINEKANVQLYSIFQILRGGWGPHMHAQRMPRTYTEKNCLPGLCSYGLYNPIISNQRS